MGETDFYKILGVSKDAGETEFKKAYRKVEQSDKIALEVHPDKNRAPHAEEAFKKVLFEFIRFLLLIAALQTLKRRGDMT